MILFQVYLFASVNIGFNFWLPQMFGQIVELNQLENAPFTTKIAKSSIEILRQRHIAWWKR